MNVSNRDCQKCHQVGVVSSRRGPAVCGLCRRNRKDYSAKWYQVHGESARTYKRENMRRYRQDDPERYAAHSRAAKKRVKDGLFELYGKVCASCGFADIRALSLDHVNHDGAEERQQMHQGGMYRQALANYQPERYRTLCMNCQFISRHEAGRQNQHG